MLGAKTKRERGLEPAPLYVWRDVSVFLPAERREMNLQKLEELGFFEVRFAPGVVPPHGFPLNEWWEVGKLWRSQRANSWRDLVTFAGVAATTTAKRLSG